MIDDNRLAELIESFAVTTALVVGDAPGVATALRARGLTVSEHAEPQEGGRYDVVVWRAPDTAEPSRTRLRARLAMAADDVLLLTTGSASAWAEVFAAGGFYVDLDVGRDLPGVLRFRKARGEAAEVDELRLEVFRRVEQLDSLYRLLDDKERLITSLQRDLAGVHATLGWRALERFRVIRTRTLRIPGVRAAYWTVRRAVEILLEEGAKEVALKTGQKLGLALRGRDFRVHVRRALPRAVNDQYQIWLEQQEASPAERRAAQAAVDRLAAGPMVSVLAVLDAADDALLHRAIQTLREQLYSRWELCVATPASVRTALKPEFEAVEAEEARLRLCATDSEDATVADAFRIATGDVVGVLDLRDGLAPDALLELVRHLHDHGDVDLVYSDEDVLEADGRRIDPFFKPEWSPDLLLASNYVGRFALVRRRLVDMVGGPRAELGPGAGYDLWLRLAEVTSRIVRVPKVLYYRRVRVASVAAMDECKRTAAMEQRAVADALGRRGLEGEVEPIPVPFGAPPAFAHRLRLRGHPLVSMIIPTRDKRHLLEQTIRSVRERTAYERYEIIVVDNESREPETLRYLEGLGAPCRVVRWPETFNFSAINNFGARHADGEYLLFLNNDVEVLHPDWLTALLAHAERPEVGAVGAKLLYPDGRIQHAGVVVGVSGAAVHAFRRWPGEPGDGPLRLADFVRDCSAVTAACMMVPRRVFDEVGGFDESLRVVFNDVDLCLRIRALGRLIVYTPLALLTHYEGASRGRLHPTPDEKLFQQRWREVLERTDPYYSPNLTDTRDDWSLRI